MNRLPILRTLALAGSMLAATVAVRAQTNAIDFSSANASNGASVWNLGFQFHVNSNVSLTALGVYDFGQNGLVGTQQVGLWTTNGALLASAFVDNSDALQGFWRFHSLSSGISLSAGNDYIIGSQGGEGYAYLPNNFTTAPQISFVTDRWEFIGNSSNSPLVFPDQTDGLNGFYGANAQFNGSVPDGGATVALLGMGLAALGFAARRRRK